MAAGTLLSLQADIEAISRISAVPQILEVICRTTGMGFAAIARVTDERWIACSVRDEINFGLQPGGELKVETTICHEIRQHHRPVLIDEVESDEIYACHHTPAMYGFQSYISVPIIRKDGTFFGTLCSIDPKPALVNTPDIKGMFTLFADLIAFHLEAVEKLVNAEFSLVEERETAELREQFIAILGHDLRNPVGAVSNAAQLLLRLSPDERTKRLAGIIQDSSYRMKALVDNMLDFARGRLGDGITLNRDTVCLSETLNQVVTELRLIWPDRLIEVEFDVPKPVNCDTRRIAQLFSNLLSNALTHGEVQRPVQVYAVLSGNEFRLSVTNSGAKIPEAVRQRLFHPFSRGEVMPHQQGLGLGLYISSEIAKAHGGNISISSTDESTCFTLSIPQ